MSNETESVILTNELIHACETEKGGFNSATTMAFGLVGPMKKGWPRRLIGKSISKSDYERALEGRFLKRCKRGFRDTRQPAEIQQTLL